MPAAPAGSLNSPTIFHSNDRRQAFVAVLGQPWQARYHWFAAARRKFPHFARDCPNCRQSPPCITWYAAALIFENQSWRLVTWDLTNREPFASLAVRTDLVGQVLDLRPPEVSTCPAGVPAPVPQVQPHDVRVHLARVWKCNPADLGPPAMPPVVPPILDTPAFRDAWSRWWQYRIGAGRPLTQVESEVHLEFLAGLGPEGAVARILSAIHHGLIAPEKEPGRYRKHAAHEPAHYAKPFVLQPWM
jgi:hypothetical protein